jgi:hypothetical protein
VRRDKKNKDLRGQMENMKGEENICRDKNIFIV